MALISDSFLFFDFTLHLKVWPTDKNLKTLAISGYFTPISCRTIFTLAYPIWYVSVFYVSISVESFNEPEIRTNASGISFQSFRTGSNSPNSPLFFEHTWSILLNQGCNASHRFATLSLTTEYNAVKHISKIP